MSRKRNLGDLDKRIKPYHVADRPTALTISHIGIETIRSRFKPEHNAIEILAGADGFNPFANDSAMTDLFVLWFKETGARMSLPLNNTNRRALIKAYGKDPDALIGKRVTLRAGKAPNGADTVLLEPEHISNPKSQGPLAENEPDLNDAAEIDDMNAASPIELK